MAHEFKAKVMPDTEELRKKLAPAQVVKLGEGLELWLVNIAVLQEQSLNARTMPSDMFLQLVDNISRRNGLESLPLCALTPKGLEIISGHHRIRAARKADLTTAWVIVDTTGLSRDEIRAKQLAHNSISGIDNDELVKQIFDLIEDADSKIEAFIEPTIFDKDLAVDLSTKGLDVEFETKVASIVFLPLQFKEFEFALKLLEGQVPEKIYLAQQEEYNMLIKGLDAAAEAYNITSTPTLFAKMAEVVIASIENDKAKADPDDSA